MSGCMPWKSQRWANHACAIRGLGTLLPARLPERCHHRQMPEATAWLNEHALQPFLGEVRDERSLN